MRFLKAYKEELVTLVLLSLALLAVRWLGVHYWSTADDVVGQYDLRSETETVSWTVLRMIIYALFAWLGVRVTVPEAYSWFKSQFKFDSLSVEERTRFVVRLFAVMFFGLVLLHASGAPATTRECVIASARADIGVRELTGNNDGERVEQYQAHVRAPRRSSWCVAFVSFHLSACGVTNPHSAWSPAYSAPQDRVWTPRKALRAPLPADVFTLFYPNLGRVGHGGFVLEKDGRYILTIEGNTSGGGSRDGDGVYQRRRELSKVYAVTNYIHDALPTSRTERATAGPAGVPLSQGNHQHDSSARQRRGALRAQGYSGLVSSGQRHRSGGGSSAWTGPGTGDQLKGIGEGNAAHHQRGGTCGLRLRQHRNQGAALGQVHQGGIAARGAEQGRRDRSEDAHPRLGVVVARGQHPLRGLPRRALLHPFPNQLAEASAQLITNSTDAHGC